MSPIALPSPARRAGPSGLPLLMAAVLLVLAGCASSPRPPSSGAPAPRNPDPYPDAVPRIEELASGANRPYSVLGRLYVPTLADKRYPQQGIASWYGPNFHGKKTSNGEIYDMYKMTAAHPTLPIPSYVRVRHLASGRTALVRVNDRGPFYLGRIIDLSYVAARKLGLVEKGSGTVSIERITNEDIRSGRWRMAQESGGPLGEGEAPTDLLAELDPAD